MKKAFAPVPGKFYHVHVEGIKKCIEGMCVAVTRDWCVLQAEDDHEQAFPLELVVGAHERQEKPEVDSDKLAAMKTLFPEMPEEIATELLNMLPLVQSGEFNSLDVLLKSTRH